MATRLLKTRPADRTTSQSQLERAFIRRVRAKTVLRLDVIRDIYRRIVSRGRDQDRAAA